MLATPGCFGQARASRPPPRLHRDPIREGTAKRLRWRTSVTWAEEANRANPLPARRRKERWRRLNPVATDDAYEPLYVISLHRRSAATSLRYARNPDSSGPNQAPWAPTCLPQAPAPRCPHPVTREGFRGLGDGWHFPRPSPIPHTIRMTLAGPQASLCEP